MGFYDFSVQPNVSASEFIRIDRQTHDISGGQVGYSYIDADTLQHVYYIPSLEVSGYGETKEKALEMLKFNMAELFNFLLKSDVVQMKRQLEDLGWAPDKLLNREFSKASIDMAGALEGINAVDGKIERINFTAAA